MPAPDFRISIFYPSLQIPTGASSPCIVRDIVSAGDLYGGQVQYEDTPGGCNAGALTLGLRFEEVYQRGCYDGMNLVEISTGDDTLQQAVTTNLATNSGSLSSANWTISGSGALATGGPGGATDFELSSGASSGQIAFTKAVTAGQVYTLSFWADPSHCSGANPGIGVYDLTHGANIQLGTVTAGATAGRFTVTATIPSGCTSAEFFCYGNSTTIAGGQKLKFSQPMIIAGTVGNLWWVPDSASFPSGEVSPVARLFVTSMLPYGPAYGEDSQQIYIWDGSTLTMGIPVLAVGSDAASGQAFLDVANPPAWPGNPVTIAAYGAGAIVGRRRYAGIIRQRERASQKAPKATITLGPLSAAFDEAVGGYTVGTTAGIDVTTFIWQIINQFSSQWPQLNISQANFSAMTGSIMSGQESQETVGQMISNAMQAIAGITTALTSSTTAGTGTVLPVTAGTGTLFGVGASINIDSGANAETCTVTANAANSITVASTEFNHASGVAITNTSSDDWFVRVGHDRTPRMIRLYQGATNTYAYNVTLQQGASTFEPLAIDVIDENFTQYFNRVLTNGNTNPATGQPYSAITSDAASANLIGRYVDAQPLANTALNTNLACAVYGEGQLDQYSLGQEQVTFRVYTRNDQAPYDQLPQGLSQGDVIRGVQCVTLEGFNAIGTSINNAPDSEVLASENWTPGSPSLFYAADIDFSGFNGWGISSGTAWVDGPMFRVAPGQQFVLSAYIGAAQVTAGTMQVFLWTNANPGVAVPGSTITQTNGANGRLHTTPSFAIPANSMWAQIRYIGTGITCNASQIGFFGQTMLSAGSVAIGYTPNYAAPNVYGLASSVVTTLDVDSGDRWQDVTFAPIEPDWTAAMAQRQNALASSILANATTGAGVDSYCVSSAAYPPTYSASSLVMTLPTFEALFAPNSNVVEFGFETGGLTITLPASATTWIWLLPTITYELTSTPAQPIAGAILYGYATTNATGIIGFTSGGKVSALLSPLLARIVPLGSDPISVIVPIGDQITYVDNTPTTGEYEVQVPFDANTGVAAWATAFSINFAYRVTGTTALTALSPVTVHSPAGVGTDTTGTVTFQGLPYSSTTTYDLLAQYVTPTLTSSWVLVTTTTARSAAATTATGTIPGGTTASATLVSLAGSSGQLQRNNIGAPNTLVFTVPSSFSPSTATWLATVRVRQTRNAANPANYPVPPTLQYYLLTPDTSDTYTTVVYIGVDSESIAVDFLDVHGNASAPSAILWSAPAVRLPSSGGSGTWPTNTTFAASGSISSYSSTGGGAYLVVGTLSLTVTLPAGSQPLATYMGGILILGRVAGSGDTGGGTDTNIGDYPFVLEVASPSLPTAFTTPALPAGIACDLAIAFFDNSGATTAAYPFATTSSNPASLNNVTGNVPAKNLVVNGDNCAGTGSVAPSIYGWTTAYSGGAIASSGAYAQGSATFNSMGLSAGGAGSGVYQLIPVVPGDTYTYMALLYTAAAGYDAAIYIGNSALSVQYNASPTPPVGYLAGAPAGLYAGAPLIVGNANNALSEWQLAVGTFTVPTTNTNGLAAVALLNVGSSGGGGECYFYGVQVFQGNRLQDYIAQEPNPGGISFARHLLGSTITQTQLNLATPSNSGGNTFNGSSTPLNTQVSIPAMPDQSTFSYSATTTTITVSWSAFTIYFADGSTVSVVSGSKGFTGLSTNTTYYVNISWNNSTGVNVSTPSTTATTSTSGLAALNSDTVTAIAIAFQCATTASGSSGPNGPPLRPTCPGADEPLRTRDRGMIAARELCVGDHLWNGCEWRRVTRTTLRPGYLVDVQLGPDTFTVDVGHVWLRAGGDPSPCSGDWIRVTDLTIKDLVESSVGPLPVRGVGNVRPDSYMELEIDGGVFEMRRGAIAHNPITY